MKSIFALLAFFFALQANAQWSGPPHVEVAVTRMMGDGCPPGSAAVNVSPDSSTVSVLFDKMNVEIPATPTLLRVRKTCTLTLSIYFGGPYRVAIVGSDIRGFASIPQMAQATISVQHQSIFSMRPEDLKKMNLVRNLSGPQEQDLVLQSRFTNRPLWSYCGTQMRRGDNFPFMFVFITMDAQNQNPDANLLTTVDSFDLNGSAALQYHLIWKLDTKSCPR